MDSKWIITPDGELYHWGIIGMKWGRRRYQTKDGSLTPAGRKRYSEDMAKIKAETKKLKAEQRTASKMSKLEKAKQELEALRKAKDKKKSDAEETDEQKKERILKEPTPKDVYENRHLFSNKEIQELSQRLNNENTIKNLQPKEIDAGKEKVDKFMAKIGDLTANTGKLIKAYNTGINIVNAFLPMDQVSFPKISTDVDKDNRSARRGEKIAISKTGSKSGT